MANFEGSLCKTLYAKTVLTRTAQQLNRVMLVVFLHTSASSEHYTVEDSTTTTINISQVRYLHVVLFLITYGAVYLGSLHEIIPGLTSTM